MIMKFPIFFLILMAPVAVYAQEPTPTTVPTQTPAAICPPDGGVCLTKDEKEKVVAAVKELDEIHQAKAVLELQEPIIVIRDWNDRIYINGGKTKPIRARLRLGSTIDREMEATIDVQVHYREKPPDPLFRLRIRAQAGILVPEAFRTIKNGNVESFWDASLGLDFVHIGIVNAAAYTGIRSVGIGPGIDLMKNFGVIGGYAFKYDGFASSAFISAYFSFN